MAPGREITVTAVKGQSKRRADPTFFLIPTPAAVYKGEPTPRSKRAAQGRLAVEREIRPLLRDYVEILLLTGIRHGTEEMGLYWNHLEWHESERKKYLRLWVAGKTGGRWLIAKHRAITVFERLAARQRDLEGKSFETILQSRVPQKVFRFSTGYQPHSFIGTFRRLMRDSGLLRATDGQNRTLYSLRHTYATQELLAGTDIHTLARQLGNSAQMIGQ